MPVTGDTIGLETVTGLGQQIVYLGLATTSQFLMTFKQYPPSQVPDSWSVDKLTEKFLSSAQQ